MTRPVVLGALLFVGCPEEPHGPRATPPPVPVDAGPRPPRPENAATPTELDIGPDDAANRSAHVGAALALATGQTRADTLPIAAGSRFDGTIGLGNFGTMEQENPDPAPDEPPPPGFVGRFERAARVTAVTGAAPVGVGALCRVVVVPVRDLVSNCQVTIACGATTLFGGEGAGYSSCFVERGAPARAYDRLSSWENADPMIFVDLVHDRAVVSDEIGGRSWKATLALVR